ncbi:TetR/AcrR family transcriptional regulator [Siculibacillus lacustris]|uniref:TetR/AcrR family transcriptional regulator n=1 Tax=Siculibacillus lacustris TaxID=1549641 RepID=A0A4Q9VWD8_9HYPH|nr:TetR/AcrR family transcriptional regulator [Siculibacillus lacustris]TBW40632.1 TetR/AcrR family transcriptional regulator [Siculibacillus lacustris]
MAIALAEQQPDERSPKVALILDAAFELFLARGFDSVSMDLIAKTAGVSKTTLYAHFTSKEALFSKLLINQCGEFSARVHIPDEYTGDLTGTLRGFALDFISVFEEEHGMALYRLIVGEIHRFPQIARAFEAAGPSEMNGRLVHLLRQIVERGELKIDDFDLAAEQFMALLTGRMLLNRALGLPGAPQSETERQVEAAIALFLRGYAIDRRER